MTKKIKTEPQKDQEVPVVEAVAEDKPEEAGKPQAGEHPVRHFLLELLETIALAAALFS